MKVINIFEPIHNIMNIENLIVISNEDTASCNIKKLLLELSSWEEYEPFSGNQTFIKDNTLMVTIDEFHLYYDNIDEKVAAEFGIKPELVIFASRHRSESGLKTLTIHPIGNFTDAKFGGKNRKLVLASPLKMAQALRVLRDEGRELEHKISYEATHHGPYLETPSFFIEIGSDKDAWIEEAPAIAIARTLLETITNPADQKDKIAIGIGGGHYVPRLTDVVRSHHIAFGHMIPNYAVDMDWDGFKLALKATPGVECVYFHKKALKKSRYREIRDWCEQEAGLKAVDSKSLEIIEK
jgi:D-aminoacyl-tRNA deacylase